jgi:uncharacterized protein (TIGR03435 family)
MMCDVVHAQMPPANPPNPRFDVSSVKPAQPNGGQFSIVVEESGRFVALNATPKRLIEFAYSLMDNDVAGGANWIDSATFNVLAKPEGPTAAVSEHGAMMRKGGPYRLMVQSLLADRFQLKTHMKPRELTVYDLVVAKRGFLLQPATDIKGIRLGPGMIGGQITLDTLAQVLTRQVGRNINNHTGLTGTYNLTLQYEPVTAGALNTGETAASTDRPSIFTAIDTQLGLTLEARKEMVEVLMIDNIQHPSDN